MAILGPTPPWPLGLVTTVLAGVLLWTVSGRLRLRPETRAASTALFACGALLSQVTTDGVDGRATLLLAAAAAFASAGRRRSVLALLACAGAVAVAPVVGVGLLVLLGTMALTRDLGARFPVVLRWSAGVLVVAAGAGVAVLLARAGAADPEALTVSTPVVAALAAATVLVGGVLATRLAWTRAPVAAVVALAACACLPGTGPDTVLPVTAGIAILAAVLAEEYRRLFARPVLVAATITGVVVTAGLLPTLVGSKDDEPPQVRPAAEQSTPAPRIRPVAIQIPRLGLSGPLGDLTPAENGELLAPDDPGLAGWYAAGVVPGDVGPAVIGGHVDSRSGPGVFFGLRSLRPGDVVKVTRSDGSLVQFRVTEIHEVAKKRFPTEEVYAPTPRPELRLVTCGGTFDRAARSYLDNVVVDAVATQSDHSPPGRPN